MSEDAPLAADITQEELAKHNSAKTCYVAIDGRVYDVTDFLPSHPGGSKIVVDASGKDASEIFHSFHSPSVLDEVASKYLIGQIEGKSNVSHFIGSSSGQKYNFEYCTADEVQALVNVEQFAAESLKRLPPALGFGYINYGAEDEQSLNANLRGWERYSMRPRVLQDVSMTDTRTEILGRIKLDFPICICPFAGSMAAHPEGEVAIAAAAAAAGISYAVPHYAGIPLPHITDGWNGSLASDGDTAARRWPSSAKGLMFQLYPVKKAEEGDADVDDATKRLVKMGIRPSEGDAGLDFEYASRVLDYVTEGGFEAVILTVDVANNANRERTYKNSQWVLDIAEQCGGMPSASALDLAPRIGTASGHTAALSWKDVAWLREETKERGLCLLVKGVMTGEDTALAADAGLDGVICSNHGGRQLDGTDGTAECIEECVHAAGGKLEVFVDGGVRRGKDVFKAIALGAKAVFIGRPVLWGLSVGGQIGVERILSILREEFLTVMQLCGCADVASIKRAHVRDRLEASRL